MQNCLMKYLGLGDSLASKLKTQSQELGYLKKNGSEYSNTSMSRILWFIIFSKLLSLFSVCLECVFSIINNV